MNLPTGWYTVTVTSSDGQQSVGWYWVPKRVRGRGKLAAEPTLAAYPNPFAAQTTIEFSVTETTDVTLSVFSLDGQEVTNLFRGQADANAVNTVQFNASDLPAGVYVVKLITATGEVTYDKLFLAK